MITKDSSPTKECATMYHFPVTAPYSPMGDQPQAIEALVEQLGGQEVGAAGVTRQKQKYAVLRGCTGTGKTLVMAHTIARLGRCKTLVLCHNKTLAAQLARELRTFFDKNKKHYDADGKSSVNNNVDVDVELFVSYYNHYVPESFSETTNKYIAKKSSISDELDALRHLATKSLLEASISSSNSDEQSPKKATIIVSSVSCIYGLGMPSSYLQAVVPLKVGQSVGSTLQDFTETLERSSLYTNAATADETSLEQSRDDSSQDFALLGQHSRDLSRGQFDLVMNNTTMASMPASATLYIWPPTEAFPMRIDLECQLNDASSLYQIVNMAKGHSAGMTNITDYTLYPARHFVAPDPEQFQEACNRIQDELQQQVQTLKEDGKHVEADRLSQRVSQDLILLRETGTCPGIENYSRHLALRDSGEPPDTLLDYLGYNKGDVHNGNCKNSDDWLLIVDESHVTLPQLKAMYHGDRARKLKLVKHGYRLPSCLDNRPLTDEEFWERVPQAMFVSATPGSRELDWLKEERRRQQQRKQLLNRATDAPPWAPVGSVVQRYFHNDTGVIEEDMDDDSYYGGSSYFENDGGPVDMMIRPTFVCDPVIEVRPAKGNQLQDLVDEIRLQKSLPTKSQHLSGHRTLALTLTKRDAEDLADYLVQQGISSTYIHSGLTMLERSQALTALQDGSVDCLVGVNCLREGLDLPQVSLVAIWNADSEGFLRSETALLQMVGRAARNIYGKAIFYANRVTDSMQQCMDATAKRRQAQLAYNAEHGKCMKSTKGSSVLSIFDLSKERIQAENEKSLLAASRFEGKRESETLNGLISDIENSIILDKVSIPVSTLETKNDQFNESSGVDKVIETDHVPSKPGVYFWKDGEGNILYIGKAKRLRSRVKSYLSPNSKHSSRIRIMLKKAMSVEFVLTPSDRDALLLESNLIKHHQPLYNVLLKDDESYPYICATVGDSYPQFTIVPRRHEQSMSTAKYRYFGPYPNFSELHKVLQGIEAKYDLRGKCFQARHGSANETESRIAYQRLFNNVMEEVFIVSRSSSRDHELEELASLRSVYEEASRLFDSEYNVCRDVVAVARIPDTAPSNSSPLTSIPVIIHVVQLRNGIVAGSFSYTCEVPSGSSNQELGEEDFAAAIHTVLERRHYPSGGEGSANFFPDEILIPFPLSETRDLKAAIRSAQKSVTEASSLTQSTLGTLDIRVPSQRGPRKETDARALEFATDNAEQIALQKSFELTPDVAKTSVDGTAIKELVSLLSLHQAPRRIECYDISHTQGDVAVGSRVVFIDGKRVPHLYRKFNIKTVQGVDDYASLEEVLERRFRRSWDSEAGRFVASDDPWALPDLVVIDGGQGQLSAAVKGMARANVFPYSTHESGSEFQSGNGQYFNDTDGKLVVVEEEIKGTTVPIVALAKQKEQVFVHGKKGPVNDTPDSAALLLLRSLRDESHRFALTAHRKRRSAMNGL